MKEILVLNFYMNVDNLKMYKIFVWRNGLYIFRCDLIVFVCVLMLDLVCKIC